MTDLRVTDPDPDCVLCQHAEPHEEHEHEYVGDDPSWTGPTGGERMDW